MIKEKREKLYKEVKKLNKSGLSAQEIAKLLDITRQRVYQILDSEKKLSTGKA